MSHLTRQDADLHHDDGSHRSTPPTTSGASLARYERRIRAHLEDHARRDRETTDSIEYRHADDSWTELLEQFFTAEGIGK